MPRKSLKKTASAHVALCYVRLSWTKDESDANSPERQRANIQLVCDAQGWTPEWYEDADGHKTGTKEKNRPGWLALKARLGDADVVALVANDLSRLHRKGWRVGDLLDFVDEHDVKLLLAALGKQMDFSTPQGRIFSVKRSIYERDLGRLLQLLTVDSEQIDFMTALGIQALTAQEKVKSDDVETQKRAGIAKCHRRIDAARNLYEGGDLSREEYLKRKEANEREIAHWEASTVETEKIALELTLCLEAINRVNELWEISDDEDRQGMARNLFSSITYNLDTQRIVDFKLKPWADRFITLRTALYEDENANGEGNKIPSNAVQGVGKGVVLTGCRMYPRYLVVEFHMRRRRKTSLPRIDNPPRLQLYRRVQELRSHGFSYLAIARQMGLSVGTVWNYAKILTP